MSDISNRLLAAIEQKGISYGELSKITGIPKSAIQRYATGVTGKIPLDRLESMAAALGVPSKHLMGWGDEQRDDFSPGEKRLVLLYRRADEIDKNTIRSILSRYDEEGSQSSEKSG